MMHCGGDEYKTCSNTMDKQCSNDDTWSAVVDNETISCNWFEDKDEPGCGNTYLEFLIIPNFSDPRVSCCYCSQYCQDLPNWKDVRNGYFARGTSRMILPNVLCTGHCGLILSMSMLINLVVIVLEVTILHLLIHACVRSKIGVNVRVVGI